MSAPAVAFAAPADVELAPNPIHPDLDHRGQAAGAPGGSRKAPTAPRRSWRGPARPAASNGTMRSTRRCTLFRAKSWSPTRTATSIASGPGDMAFFPAGSHSVWQVTKTVRKLAVCRHSMPRPFGFVLRAWNKAVPSPHRLPDRQRPRRGQPCQAPAVRKSRRRTPCSAHSAPRISLEGPMPAARWAGAKSLTFRRLALINRQQAGIPMKVRNSLKSLRGRHRDNRIVRRKGRVYVINKTQRRFKARQG